MSALGHPPRGGFPESSRRERAPALGPGVGRREGRRRQRAPSRRNALFGPEAGARRGRAEPGLGMRGVEVVQVPSLRRAAARGDLHFPLFPIILNTPVLTSVKKGESEEGKISERKCLCLVPPLLPPTPTWARASVQMRAKPISCEEYACKHSPEQGVCTNVCAPMILYACSHVCALLHICKFLVPDKINACTDVCLSKRARRGASVRMCMCALHSQLCSSRCPAPFPLQAPPLTPPGFAF